MRKLIPAIILSLSLILFAALPAALLAHGHGGGGSAAGRTAALCALPDCGAAGDHYHDGVLRAGHYSGDGHDHGDHRARAGGNRAKTGHAHI
ncbi:MAG: hypothetical protein LBK56_12145 [Gracilibacteraceae bacterium]|jgi:hypothetical protein|nr:hypothetical protein [Gracilibacteraceae bacterium]